MEFSDLYKRLFLLSALTFLCCMTLSAREIHVSVRGGENGDGERGHPYKTISMAALAAYPGDTVTVHEGVYREWVDPPRGGDGDDRRIVYRAAAGERVEIKGSEIVADWKKTNGGLWEAKLPDEFFGYYNPYTDPIVGDWYINPGWPRHTGEVFLDGEALPERSSPDQLTGGDNADPPYGWYCSHAGGITTITANFGKHNPNKRLVEITTRHTCFYPSRQGIDYITISGFEFSQAATQWPAPTAEQIGMVATHWNKGWIIENNTIHDSKCAGITLGKERATGHNVWSADPVFDGSLHYIEVIFKTLRNGWNRENTGSHKVRGNTIYNCGQAGICGSMGAAFSEVTGNHIYNIASNGQLHGPELGGIKFHGAIDVLIKGNRIHNTEKGLFLDWMTQGTRVTCNLFYDNVVEDIYMEVNHGPFLIDNNILGSPFSLWDMSDGGAYVNNLFLGKIRFQPELSRYTPYHVPHSTDIAGFSIIVGGDDRFHNNIFMPSRLDDGKSIAGDYGLGQYDNAAYPVTASANIYFAPAVPFGKEQDAPVMPAAEEARIEETGDGVYLSFGADGIAGHKAPVINTATLGKTILAKTGYESPDGSPITIDVDYFGNKRPVLSSPGPFSDTGSGQVRIKIW